MMKMSNIKVTQEHINDLLERSEKHVETLFDKTTVVTIKLPNGYTMTEQSGCVDKDNYDEKLGAEICMEQLEHRLWELEGYLLQDNVQPVPFDDATGVVDFGGNKDSHLRFQTGVVSKYGINGVQVDEVIQALINRMLYLNSRKSDVYNKTTIDALYMALESQQARNDDREERNVEGTEQD